jgi:hypothetical protein
VSWCVAFVAAAAYLKAIDDPPVPGLTTGASQPLWAVVKASFFAGWLVALVTGTALLLHVGLPALRRRDWHVLRPLLPAMVLGVVVAGTAPVVGSYGNGAPSVGSVLVILCWLALGLALVVAGAAGPVVALRRSGVDAGRAPTSGAAAVAALAVVLAVAAVAQAGVLSSRLTAYGLTMLWGSVAVLVGCAVTSVVSTGRALRSG